MSSTAWKTGVAGLWQDAANWTNGVPVSGDAVTIGGIGSAVTNSGTVSNVSIDMKEDNLADFTRRPRADFDNKGTMLASNGGALGISWGGYGVGMTSLSASAYSIGSFGGQTIYNEGLIAGAPGAELVFDSDNDVYGTYSHYGLLSNSGLIDTNGGHVFVDADITQTATGVIAIDQGSTLDINAYVAGGLLKLNDGHVVFGMRGGHGDMGRSIAASNFGSNVEFDGPASISLPQPLTRLDFDPAANTLGVFGNLAGNNFFPLTILHLTGHYTADEFSVTTTAPDPFFGDQYAVVFTPTHPVIQPPPPAADPPPVAADPPPTPNFAILDTTTNTPSTAAGAAYSGPVAGLNWQYLDLSPNNLNITASTPNAFIHSGSGQDAIDVSHANGTNVLDGGTGSNFLVGGAGTDTFFLDDRGPSAPLWSTLVNFHAGDAATVWGLTANDFQVQTADNQGADGFAGLTFHFTNASQPTASLTLPGFSSADLSSGRVAMNYGRTGDLPNLPGSDYLSIHAA